MRFKSQNPIGVTEPKLRPDAPVKFRSRRPGAQNKPRCASRCGSSILVDNFGYISYFLTGRATTRDQPMPYRAPPLPTSDRVRATSELIAQKATDVSRWADFRNLATQWDERARMAAECIPSGARVLDVGCGAMALEEFLKQDCTYFPADVVQRRPDCAIVDLNHQQFPAGQYDWVCFLGVLEYVHNLEWPLRRSTSAAQLAGYLLHSHWRRRLAPPWPRLGQ